MDFLYFMHTFAIDLSSAAKTAAGAAGDFFTVSKTKTSHAMTIEEFIYKAKRRVRILWFARIAQLPFPDYCRHYASYRHMLKCPTKPLATAGCSNYLAARPNPVAGIGHQMANWMAGYHLAKLLGLKFAHIPFATPAHPHTASKWDAFLGFGNGETAFRQLKRQGRKVVRLPRFRLYNPEEVDVIRRIVASYADREVVFLCEQDQFYRDLNTLIPDLQRKFFAAPSREDDRLVYDTAHYNIAIHVHRGDIMADPANENLAMRYLSNDYYEKVLSQVLEHVKTVTDKPVHIYFFSQGRPEDYPEFARFPHLHWCMDMGATASFLHMVYADLLITSKSSFSYKPALLNKGIKVCPEKFWHGYPDSKDWVMVENDGHVKWSVPSKTDAPKEKPGQEKD